MDDLRRNDGMGMRRSRRCGRRGSGNKTKDPRQGAQNPAPS